MPTPLYMSSEPALLPDRVHLKQSPNASVILKSKQTNKQTKNQNINQKKKKTKPAIRAKLCTVYNKVEPLDHITCYGEEKTTKKTTWRRNGSPHGMTLLLTFRQKSAILGGPEMIGSTKLRYGWPTDG